jgi:large subunit ribosomal protein L10
MPLSRTQKHDLVAQYQEGLAEAPHAFLLGYKGISVPQVTELRAKVRDTDAQYVVVKNTLALLAIEGKALGELKEHFQGPTAVVFGDTDPVSLAKVLTDFAKTSPAIEFKAGLVDGRQVAAGQIQEIADLPSREALIAKLVYLLQSPIARFVRGLGAIPQQFVSVLDQIRAAKDEG